MTISTIQLLATNCICCGRALVDALSVEMGIGPICRVKFMPVGTDLSDESRVQANKLVYKGAVAAQTGNISVVMIVVKELREIGFEMLADTVEARFDLGISKTIRNADITISVVGDRFVVRTPFRRGDKEAFINAWRNISGRGFNRQEKCNTVPLSEKSALWSLLTKFFPGNWGNGPKGAFRVPTK